MEEEFIRNQERLKPQEEKNEVSNCRTAVNRKSANFNHGCSLYSNGWHMQF